MAITQFGQFAFDPETGALRRGGVAVRLQPQPTKVLAALVARAGEVVSRDELRQEIWGTETFVDFERGLNFCIAQIRSALGDAADSPRFIETLPKRGYRFIAPVSRAEPAIPVTAAEPVARPDPALEPARSLSLRGVAVAVFLLILVAAAVAALATRETGAVPVRIAVVPFDNETGDTEFDRIAGGVADATVSRLATPERMRSVAVIGNAAVLRRPRAFRDLKTIGQELGATFVLLAQVKSDNQRVRLIAHLIRVSDEVHVWAPDVRP